MGVVEAEILIVDNDERIVELVAWFLKKRGYGVRTAGTFDRARELIAKDRPDLMLSDIDLGPENAMEELPRLEVEGGLPPTLVVSGYLDAEIQERLASMPAVLGTLAKPFDFGDLEDRVRTCLAHRPDPLPMTVGGSQTSSEDEDGWVEITPG